MLCKGRYYFAPSLLVTQHRILLLHFAAKAHCWLILTPRLPTYRSFCQHCCSPQSSPAGITARSTSFPGEGPCTCPVASKSLQLVLNFRVFIKHTCMTLKEILTLTAESGQNYSIRNRSLLQCLEKEKNIFSDLGIYLSICRANFSLSVIFLKTRSRGQSIYSKNKKLILETQNHVTY